MSPRPALFALASAALVGSASALSIEFSQVSPSSSASSPALFVASGMKDQDGNDVFTYQNSNNVSGSDIYIATLSVAGKEFTVQLDTGSSDLWLDTTGVDLSSLTQTGITTGLSYGDGTVAQGPVYVGDISFGGFTVSSAFISAPGTNATTNQDKGLLGVGPPQLSSIVQALDSSRFNGDTLLDNIFASNTSLEQFTSFSLSRSFATGKTDGGVFTVGEIPSNLSAISNTPKNEVISSDRWVVLMDAVVVNGQNVTGGSAFDAPGQTSGQTLSNLDTGTSLSQIPSDYAQAIYGSVPGAQLVASSGLYIIPCDTKLNVSFVFSGVEYPVHPIDTVSATTDDTGNVLCFSGFTFGESGSEDFLLGDSFLRNVYSLYDYGAFLNESSTPFIQLLSTTDADSAYAEFDTLSKQRNQTLTSSSSSSSGGSNGGSTNAALPVMSSRLGATMFAASALLAGLLVL